MKPVETYVPVTPKDVEKALADKNYLQYQGGNILFTYADYKDVGVFHFLTSVFTIIGKIAVEGDKGTYFIVSDKFGSDVTEPFKNYSDVSDQLSNNIEKISDFVVARFVNKYDL